MEEGGTVLLSKVRVGLLNLLRMEPMGGFRFVTVEWLPVFSIANRQETGEVGCGDLVRRYL